MKAHQLAKALLDQPNAEVLMRVGDDWVDGGVIVHDEEMCPLSR